eukprot:Awhi_evm1s3615
MGVSSSRMTVAKANNGRQILPEKPTDREPCQVIENISGKLKKPYSRNYFDNDNENSYRVVGVYRYTLKIWDISSQPKPTDLGGQESPFIYFAEFSGRADQFWNNGRTDVYQQTQRGGIKANGEARFQWSSGNSWEGTVHLTKKSACLRNRYGNRPTFTWDQEQQSQLPQPSCYGPQQPQPSCYGPQQPQPSCYGPQQPTHQNQQFVASQQSPPPCYDAQSQKTQPLPQPQQSEYPNLSQMNTNRNSNQTYSSEFNQLPQEPPGYNITSIGNCSSCKASFRFEDENFCAHCGTKRERPDARDLPPSYLENHK